MKSNHKFGKFGAKGYYIALILCAAAIGISGYAFYQNSKQSNPQTENPSANMDVMDSVPDNIPAVGTQPNADASLKEPDASVPGDTPAQKPLQTCCPVQGKTVAEYAVDCLSYNPTTRDWRTHDGIDIAAEGGSAVCAAADGTVYTTYTDDRLGTTVVIHHADGYITVYSSLGAELMVKPGDVVVMGQAIGTVGNTALMETAIGDHLHFSVTRNGESIDPQAFLDME